jgi:hypothetical protein
VTEVRPAVDVINGRGYEKPFRHVRSV